jgi:hypothetical protein
MQLAPLHGGPGTHRALAAAAAALDVEDEQLAHALLGQVGAGC